MTEVRVDATDGGLLGMPIKGEIFRPSSRKKNQRPKSQFATLVKAALDAKGVEELRWRQYTPYFNDGDACVFGAHSLEMRVEGVEIEDGFPGYTAEAKAVLGTAEGKYDHTTYSYVYGPYTGPDEDRWNALKDMSKAIDGGEFDDVLLDLFGDHAEVKIIKDQGIEVDHVDHD